MLGSCKLLLNFLYYLFLLLVVARDEGTRICRGKLTTDTLYFFEVGLMSNPRVVGTIKRGLDICKSCIF